MMTNIIFILLFGYKRLIVESATTTASIAKNKTLLNVNRSSTITTQFTTTPSTKKTERERFPKDLERNDSDMMMEATLGVASAFEVPATATEIRSGKEITIALNESKTSSRNVSSPIDHRYVAQVHYRGYPICGGSLVHINLILSATNCFEWHFEMKRYSHFTVHLGSKYKIDEGQVIPVAEFFIHPRSNRDPLHNYVYDAVILRTEEPAILSPSIHPIPLANVGDSTEKCSVTGWQGSMAEGEDKLLTIQAPVINVDICQSLLTAKAPQYSLEQSSQMCSKRESGCLNSQGNGLVCNGKLVGIASWEVLCNDNSVPSVFTRVDAIDDWVNLLREAASMSSNFDPTTLFIMFLCVICSVR